MSGIIFTILAAIVAIGVLVTVHEYGHYIVARACGIKVLRFSVGFGKPLWSKTAGRDQTEYVIAAIPLGGYVKMLDGREGSIDPADDGRAFNQKSVARRAAVLVAGPLFNFLFAIGAFWVVYTLGVPEPIPVVGAVTVASDADRAGIEALDHITAVNGREVGTWGQANIALLEGLLAGGDIQIGLRDERARRRGVALTVTGDRTALTEPHALLRGIGLRPWSPALPAVLSVIMPDTPAAAAGFMPGDKIMTVNGLSINSWEDVVREWSARPGETVQVEVERGLAPRTLTATLDSIERDGDTVGYMGVQVASPDSDEIKALWGDKLTNSRLGIVPALGEAIGATVGNSALMLKMFWKMITLQVSVKNISGPISIAQYAGLTASDGPVYYLRFLALLSVSLGVLNLLPIPMLDGGQLVYQVAEAIKGSPVSMRMEIIGQQVGVFMLLMLMSIAFYQDIARLIAS